MSRTINFSLFGVGPESNPKVLAWCRANGLDPNDLPLNQFILEDEAASTLTVLEFVRRDNGMRLLVHDPDPRYIKRERIVPLLATLESYDL